MTFLSHQNAPNLQRKTYSWSDHNNQNPVPHHLFMLFKTVLRQIYIHTSRGIFFITAKKQLCESISFTNLGVVITAFLCSVHLTEYKCLPGTGLLAQHLPFGIKGTSRE